MKESASKILHAFRWMKIRKQHLMKTIKNKLKKCHKILCKRIKGYLYRKAFLANNKIQMDVYLPFYQVGYNSAKVYVFGNFTNKPWKTKIKCTFSDYFNSYKAIIPVINGSQFKFIVDESYMLSNDHIQIKDTESGAYNNVVQTFNSGINNELQHRARTPLLNSLSLININSLHAPIDFGNDSGDETVSVKKKSKFIQDDNFFKPSLSSCALNSPAIQVLNFEDLLPNNDFHDSSEDNISISKHSLYRPKSDCFIKNIDHLDHLSTSDQDLSVQDKDKQHSI